MGKILICGGGIKEDSFNIDKKFSELIGNKKMLYIPLARKPPYESCLEFINSNFNPHGVKDIKMIESTKELANLELDEYGGIYVGGGNTFKLAEELKHANFLKKLKKYLSMGGIIMGSSAGAVLLGKNIKTSQDEVSSHLTNLDGFNLLNKYSVICHYKGDNERVKNYFNTYKIPVIVLSEKAGAFIESKKLTSLGKDNILLYNGLFRKLEPGSTLLLT